MNVLAGLYIAYISQDYGEIFLNSIIWAVFFLTYGFLLGFHNNPIVAAASSGQPIKAYYISRFLVGGGTAFLVAIVANLFNKLYNYF